MMKELGFSEMDQVAGASFSGITTYIGNAIIDAVMISNDIFNMSVVYSVGRFFDSVGFGSFHYTLDSWGYSLSKLVAGIGTALGGDDSRIAYHFDEEWGA
ncbi:hypothetical protein ACMGGR_05965 [Erwinia sp. BNK-24-b]|uniref:hypothetical protein n=1 Tax=Erwinia TaxID=551 RepID=UPI001FEF58EC|nr:hypothetical protein [Erwinia phyllosphaerae]